MSYTNSPLVAYTRLTPNNSGERTHKIDRITPHCVVGQCTAEGLGEWFADPTTKASSNYGIDRDGRVGLYVEEKNRSWCSSSNANDQRAITIECASEKNEPYWMNNKVIDSLITLMTDCCQRNGKTKLLWIPNKNQALAYEPADNEMLITVHRWFKNKSCPGDYLYAQLGDIANAVTSRLGNANTDDDDDTPFMVRVAISTLNIRTGPGTNYVRTGEHTGRGAFTIIEVQNGVGSDSGWGRLKSGAGWISLDYATRI